MEYRRLGRSGLKVSEMGLGCNAFGGRADEPASLAVIARALDLGVNFIDTAETYTGGRSEEIIGKAVKGKRSRVIIATKFGHPSRAGPADQRGSRGYMMKAVEASLKRLDTDYIDLYYFHYPDPDTPIEETLRAMNDLVRTGKVRYLGCSNFAGWQLCEATWTARLHNLDPLVAVESMYHILDRGIEEELVPCCQAYGVGVVPWGPLAGGFLTGKYRRSEMPPGARLSGRPGRYSAFLNDPGFDQLAKLEAFARERGHSVGELAIAWLLARPWLGSVISGATKPDQVAANVAGANWKLTPEDMAAVDTALGKLRSPNYE
ncbi:MAG: aldo/keto reductase [Chloroflexi bacterium]|nr:aldo/keto reductase [Chloroflexota bacterium]